MKQLHSQLLQSSNNYDQGNCQPIKEELLRLAVKYCEFYATDVLILIDSIRKMILDHEADGWTGTRYMSVGFRQMGIDWNNDLANKYRYMCKVTLQGKYFHLEGELGNV